MRVYAFGGEGTCMHRLNRSLVANIIFTVHARVLRKDAK